MRSIAILIAVFVLGGIAGGAAVYATRGTPAGPPAAPPTMIDVEARADRLTKRLGLRPEQREQILEILRAQRVRIRAARSDLVTDVRGVLDEEQRRKFAALVRGDE